MISYLMLFLIFFVLKTLAFIYSYKYSFLIIFNMFKIFTSRNPIFNFSTKAFDLAVIGGGPGGNFMII